MKVKSWSFLLFLALPICTGCTLVSVDGVEPWVGRSSMYVVAPYSPEYSERSLRLSNVPDLCNTYRTSVEMRIEAARAREERIAEGMDSCAAGALWWEDLAEMNDPLEKAGTVKLDVWPFTSDEEGIYRSELEEGQYVQEDLPLPEDVSPRLFRGYLYYNKSSFSRAMADNFACEEGQEEWDAWAVARDASGDTTDSLSLAQGTLDLVADGQGWEVDLSARLVDDDVDVGSISTRFTADLCEVQRSPCTTCLAGGGTWQPEAEECTVDCDIPDISCVTASCPY